MPTPKKSTLHDRIKAIAAANAPSMVPQSKDQQASTPAPPPKEVEVIPALDSLVKNVKQRLEIARLVARAGELGQQLSALKKQREPIIASLKKMAGTLHIGKAITGDWRLNYFAGTRSSLNTQKLTEALMKRGMLPNEVIKVLSEATDEKPVYTMKISEAGKEEEEYGEGAA